ncbi:galactosylceramide sulfotransferase-like isoform X2 [Bolinopsis microptera]|uniref:galactosylceramide sulfotransferase-like isoform X2 n=1 Tax=Bolinopsis microptera TaxID=2820187 RepID=UPI0030794B2D
MMAPFKESSSSTLRRWRITRFKNLVLVALVCILIVCLCRSQLPWNHKFEITLFPGCEDKELGECQVRSVLETIRYYQNSTPRQTTTNKRNLMFIKTHKCGTSSLVNTFYLMGVRSRLNFVVQQSDHPHTLALNIDPAKMRPLLPPRPGTVYNIQCQHGTFQPDAEHTIMPKETSFYSTIVRSPVSQFKSAFSFFGGERKMRKRYGKVSMDELIGHYLDQQPAPTEYDAPHSVYSINGIAADLGWYAFSESMAGSTLQEKINAFIEHLDQEMDFVMITDRMNESLILLKEYLGWNMTDIVYLNRMVSSKPKVTMSEETKARILKYQVIDVQIFDHFNKTFELHLDRVGREKVASQVKKFEEMRESFENKCFNKNMTVKGPYGSVSWEITDYGRNTNLACTFLQTRDIKLTNVVTQLQLTQDYTVPIDQPLVMRDMVSKIQRDYDNNEDPV